jgi:lactoylglutathione lyase
MRLEHFAVWTPDLERLRAFYERYFDAVAGGRYHNPAKRFSSYFLEFGGGARLELMHRADLFDDADPAMERLGYAHLAIAVGSEAAVDALTERFRGDGHRIAGEPRRTGDGYYESVVLDPDGNRIEITV